MKTIAFFNLKGGVGKTTSAVNIAYLAAQDGLPTLLWDLDPQGAASWLLQQDEHEKIRPKKVLSGKTPIGDLVQRTQYPLLDIIPADFSYRRLDVLLADLEDNPIEKLLAPFSENYSLIILDCPPSFSTLSERIFATADALFMPMIPAYLSLRSFEKTHEFFVEKNLKHKKLYGFFNMVDMRRSLHRVMTSHPPKALVKQGLKTHIPYAANIEKMGDVQAPLPSYAANSPAGVAYQALWQEVKQTLTLLK